MYKKTGNQYFFYKFTYSIFFCILIFLQLQVKYIAALNYFTGKNSVTAEVKIASHKINIQKNRSNNNTFFKLNKRFQLNNFFTISPLSFIKETGFTALLIKRFYQATFSKNAFHLVFLFRGPPAISKF